MKKKILPLLLSLACAIICAFPLAACDKGGDGKLTWLYVAKTGEEPVGSSISYVISYGETPDLTTYKLYGHYSKSGNKELPLTDEKLSVKYYSYDTADGVDKEINKLPDEWIKGTYRIEYIYDGNSKLKAEVYIYVNQARSGAFSLQPVGGATWQAQGDVHDVIVKNPKGAAVKKEYVEGTPKHAEKTDDTDGEYDLYLFKKSVYDGFTEAQKKDYEFLYQCYSDDLNKETDHEVFWYRPEFDAVVGVEEGEYMLLALVTETYNYWRIVTPAVKITVTAPAV